MRLGAPVVVIRDCSGGFVGRLGVVVAGAPVMVLLEGEARAMRFGPTEIAPASECAHWMATR